jgi:BirA family biotin operon repressor/biotin-[acetyl-CoA-carboxylase] ligase
MKLDPFDLGLFETERARRRLRLGSPVSWPEQTESTNDDALAAAKKGALHGALFGAETQTRGRGRRGSDWHSTPGAGLWFSLLLRPRLRAEVAPLVALCAGLSVREVVAARASASVLVKWPNDVLADGLKVAGVLVESQVSGQQVSSVVVGIGLNVEQLEFPPELGGVATSLALLEASRREREPLLAGLLGALELRLGMLEIGNVGGILAELRNHDALLDRRLCVDDLAGTGAGIDDAGRLLLRLPSGELRPIISGHVTFAR